MKLAILGNFLNPHSTENHHEQALSDLGHQVITLQEGDTTAGQLVSRVRGCQALLWVHTHGWQTPGNISDALRELRRHGVTVLAYHLDLWIGLSRQKDLSSLNPFFSEVQHWFTVDRRMADWLNNNTPTQAHYLSAAVSHRECWMVPDPRPDLDVVFVGSHRYHPEWAYRNELISRLHARYGDRFHLIPGRGQVVRGPALNRLYGRSKVVVGDSLCPGFDYPDYWSDRVYETLGRGGMLIHPRISGLDTQFRDREHLAFYDYNDWTGLFDLVDHYLNRPESRESIRASGHAEVHRAHTYLHRWQTILETIG